MLVRLVRLVQFFLHILRTCVRVRALLSLLIIFFAEVKKEWTKRTKKKLQQLRRDQTPDHA